MTAPSSEISNAPSEKLPARMDGMPNNGDRISPARNAPTIPTTTFRRMPCCASVRIIRLASQPNMPPTMTTRIRFIGSSFPPILFGRSQPAALTSTRNRRDGSVTTVTGRERLAAVAGMSAASGAPHQFDRRQDQGAARQPDQHRAAREIRSEEHTSELQSLMRISYAVFCLKKKN